MAATPKKKKKSDADTDLSIHSNNMEAATEVQVASSISTSPSAARSRRSGNNPLAFLGLRRIKTESGSAADDQGEDDVEDDEDGPFGAKKGSGIELNRRGVPARKRKKNSLIYGADDLVSIPIRSPKKKTPKTSNASSPVSSPEKKRPSSAVKSKATPLQQKLQQRSVRSKVKPGSRPETPPIESRRSISGSSSAPASIAKRNTAKRSFFKRGLDSPKKGLFARSKQDSLGELCKGRSEDGELTSPEKKCAQALGVSLRNLLKLPKAHKWICYEFFYSNIDSVLFNGENDFVVCLRESFPQLRTRRLSRVEWCKIRRMIGKPRRCSAAFFAEERAELARKRHKIRLLQQRKTADIANFKDLPEDIPLQLTIGARVTARLRKPQDGLFTGTVDAYDTSNNTYRITFDRSGLGTHSIPDYEVVSTQDPDMMPLSSFTAKVRPRPAASSSGASSQAMPVGNFSSPMKYTSTYSPGLANDPLLSGSTPRGKVMRMDGQLGPYPVRFLEQIVRLSKCLKVKRERVNSLRELNSQGEKKKSFGEYITEDFQRKYAATVIDLSQINRDLNEHLKNIHEYTQQFSSEAGPTISLPNIIREGCQEDAYDMVNKNNTCDEKDYVENPKLLALISSLTALMLQVKHLADGERNAFELQALQDSLAEIKQNIRNENYAKFENSVEVHMQHIQSGLSQLGNLHAFMRPQHSIKTEPA